MGGGCFSAISCEAKMREEQKQRFIELRALGKSYDTIATELHVAKGTLTKWSKELAAEVSRAKDLQREALYETFRLTKESRIRQLGGTLQRFEDELATRDLSDISTGRLADLILKYSDTLRNEVQEITETEIGPNMNADDIFAEFRRLLVDLRSGRITRGDAQKDALVLAGMQRAYETTTLEQKLDAIKAATERT